MKTRRELSNPFPAETFQERLSKRKEKDKDKPPMKMVDAGNGYVYFVEIENEGEENKNVSDLDRIITLLRNKNIPFLLEGNFLRIQDVDSESEWFYIDFDFNEEGKLIKAEVI